MHLVAKQQSHVAAIGDVGILLSFFKKHITAHTVGGIALDMGHGDITDEHLAKRKLLEHNGVKAIGSFLLVDRHCGLSAA